MPTDTHPAGDTPAPPSHWMFLRERRQLAVFHAWMGRTIACVVGGLIQPGWLALVETVRTVVSRDPGMPPAHYVRLRLRDGRHLDLLVWDYLRLPGPTFRSAG